MKNYGILNPELSKVVASCGHTDYIVLADKGYPIPKEVDRINLGFMDNHPTILELLKALSLEMSIERIIVTNELREVSPDRLKELKDLYPSIEFELVSHVEFKDLAKGAMVAVKTADTCPYANIMVVSG